MRSIQLSALCLATLLPVLASAAPACPTGQHPVCLGACFCVPDALGAPGEVYDTLGRMAAGTLANWLRHAREVAAGGDIQPVPLHIRARLESYYGLHVLETARYTTGAQAQLDAANALLQNPDVHAVTLVDVIVFRQGRDAQENVALWAHELMHVQQFLEWGVDEFAARYSRDYRLVEAPAYAIQQRVASAEAAGPGAATPRHRAASPPPERGED